MSLCRGATARNALAVYGRLPNSLLTVWQFRSPNLLALDESGQRAAALQFLAHIELKSYNSGKTNYL